MTNPRYLLIPVEGPLQILRPGTESYDTLNTAIGGYIQCVPLQVSQVNIWLHEEGKIIGLPHNPRAQLLWEHSYGRTDSIVGPAVFTGGADDEGETVGLTHTELLLVASVALQSSVEGQQEMDDILKEYES